MYPENYRVMSRDLLLLTKPTPNTAVLFIHGNLKTDLDVPRTYYSGIAHIHKFDDFLNIAIDDVCEEDLTQDDINRYHPYFITDEKIQEIDAFLQKNHNKNIIISCVAGISRSGAVGWYLDQRNHRDSNWSYKTLDGVTRPISDMLFPHLDMYRKFRQLL